MVRRLCVYKNVAVSMFLQGISISRLADECHISYKTLCRKLNGDTSVSVEEAILIYEVLGKPMPIYDLFSRE